MKIQYYMNIGIEKCDISIKQTSVKIDYSCR